MFTFWVKALTPAINPGMEINYNCENVLTFEFMDELRRYKVHSCAKECANDEKKNSGLVTTERTYMSQISHKYVTHK